MEFRGQYQSVKIKICEIYSYFWQIGVEEFVASMVAVCYSYFPQVDIHLRQDQCQYTLISQQFVTTSRVVPMTGYNKKLIEILHQFN